MARLNIPSRYKQGLSKINSLTDVAFQELAAALRDFRTVSISPETITRIAEKTPHITTDDVDLFLETLLALQLARTGSEKSVEQFSADVLDELGAPGSHQLKVDEKSRQRFAKRLKILFGFESLTLVAKARELQVEHGHVFLNGRIITDLRPVFRGLPQETPLGMVLVHTLKVSFINREAEGGQARFYVALDEADIVALRKVLDRAEAKARTLRAKLTAAGIQCLGEPGRAS